MKHIFWINPRDTVYIPKYLATDMQIFIIRSGNQQEGPYNLYQINDMIRHKTLKPYALAWYEGLSEWIMVKDIPNIVIPNFETSPIKLTDALKQKTHVDKDTVISLKGMSFHESIAYCLSKYAVCTGRARRSEYWWFYLFTILVSWGAGIVGAVVLDESLKGIPAAITNLVLLFPSISVAVRRLHDTGKSGWWLPLAFTCIGIIPLTVWLASPGETKANQYGTPV